jgi:general secretion pathway protein K
MINLSQRSLGPQRGVALIMVLLVVAIIVVIAANMTGRLQLLMSRSINMQASQQGMWSALAGEQLVFNVLEQDYKDDPQRVHLAQLWAREGMIFPLDDGALSGEVKDLHSCFNINALAEKSDDDNSQRRSLAQRQFEVLLRSMDVEDYAAELLSYTIGDWVDSDKRINGNFGAEDSTYASKTVPYITANSPIGDVSELLAIEGMTPAIYRKIKPFVCALTSTINKINVNTIKADNAEILVALFENKLNISDAKSVISSRDAEGFKSVSEFLSAPEIVALGNLTDEIKNQFDIKSSDFTAILTFTVDVQSFTLNSVYHRDGKGKLHVVSRQIGNNE